MDHVVYTINSNPNTSTVSPRPSPARSARPVSMDRFSSLKKKLTRKNISVALLVLLVIVIGSYLWMRRLPPLNASAKTLAQFEASSRFASLSLADQQKYNDAFRAISWQDRRAAIDGLTDSQRADFRANTEPLNPRAQERNTLAKAFNDDHTAAGKRAILKKVFDQQQARAANRPTTQPAGGPPPGANAGRGGNAPGDQSTPMREMRESMSEMRMENGLPSHR